MVTEKRRSITFIAFISERNGMMLDNKYFDVDTNDFVIIDGVKVHYTKVHLVCTN